MRTLPSSILMTLIYVTVLLLTKNGVRNIACLLINSYRNKINVCSILTENFYSPAYD